MPAYVWMWILFLLTLLGGLVAGSYATIPWYYWLIPAFFFVLALILTLDTHSHETS